VTIQFKQSVSADQRSLLKNTLAALKPFKNLRDTMPLQCAATFLLVASEEGLNVNAYAKRAGIRPPLMTRHLADIGKTNRYHEEGFGLVEQFDNVLDRRERLIRLTTKGRNLVREICEAFSG
jgi:DNA-binding MarR family transcriptional regulator